MAKPLHTVAFTEGFIAQAKAEGVTEAELNGLVQILAANPEAGDLIVGSGGCRKVRFAGRGKGKSGGYRAITVLPSPVFPVYVLAMLSKGSQGNFTAAQIAALAAVAQRIKASARPKAVGS